MAYKTSILVTGGTMGLGYHCAFTLAQQQHSTLIVVASRADPDSSAIFINKALSQSNVLFMPLDLSSKAKVREFVKRWQQANHPPISALVLNAGIQFPGEIEWNVDGIEKTFAIDHVGHALLFHLLAAGGYLTNDARTVVTSSGTHDPAMRSGITARYSTAEEVARPSKELAKLQQRAWPLRNFQSRKCNLDL